MNKLYIIKWHNQEAREYYDVIPAGALRVAVPDRGLKHLMIGRSGDVIEAAYDVEPQHDGTILLRYGGENAVHNDEVGVFIGDMRIDPGSFATASYLDWRGAKDVDFEPLPVTIVADFNEGETTLALVNRRKRSARLRKFVRALGSYRGQCDACGSKPHAGYGEAGFSMFEGHHVDPLHEGMRKTGIGSVAYLCANCHRVITQLGNPRIEIFIEDLRRATSGSSKAIL